jgi:signal transduction histidine kinase
MSAEVKSEKLSSLVTETIALNEEMSRQLRTMSYLLHPPLIDEMGLPSALRWYTEGFEQRSGIKAELQIGSDFGRLPADMEITLFRVVQECLTNIHRHSGSLTAKISVSRTGDEVRVEIIDQGNGIPAERRQADKVIPGVGLMGIEERMRRFGGTVDIASAENGTTVVATMPFKIASDSVA